MVWPPGQEGLATPHTFDPNYFHPDRLSHLTCIDIMANRWYPENGQGDHLLRSYKFKLHNQHVQLWSEQPYICNTDSVVPEPQNE